MEQKAWGIYLARNGDWVTSCDGLMFWTNSRAAADAFFSQSSFEDDPEAEVRSFEDVEAETAAKAKPT